MKTSNKLLLVLLGTIVLGLIIFDVVLKTKVDKYSQEDKQIEEKVTTADSVVVADSDSITIKVNNGKAVVKVK